MKDRMITVHADALSSIKAFLQVVECGGFSAAAQRMGLSTPTIRGHVARLESRLGVRLLRHGHHTLALTEAGRVYFERCRTLLDDLESASGEIRPQEAAPRGTLRLTCPSWFAGWLMASTLVDFRAKYPDVIPDVSFEDRYVDLVEEGYDLALRVTARSEAIPLGLIAREVRPLRACVAASREYLNRRGAPQAPAELAQHDCVAVDNEESWVLRGPEGSVQVPARVVVRCRSLSGAASAVAAGIGLSLLPQTFLEDPVYRKALIPILPQFGSEERSLRLVYVNRRSVPRRISAFIDFMLQRERLPAREHTGNVEGRH
jgi:DNA-binding transcriptional LysR family regulator